MAAKKKPKITVLTPKVSKKKEKEEEMPRTKRAVIVYKKDQKIDNLYHILGELEEAIRELCVIYAELPDSKHRGVGGRMKPTPRQVQIERQIEQTQARAVRIMKLIERKVL